MLSTADMVPPEAVNERDSCVSVVKVRQVSNGVTVSHLQSGEFALSAHDGEHRAIVQMTGEELRDFAKRLLLLVA